MKSRFNRGAHKRIARSFEPLEPRLALDGSAAPIGADGYLTLSFAQDGVLVAGQPNGLASTFGQLGSDQQWQDTILRAFQTWAIHTNADVGLVDDSGDPFGTPGATRDDERFGDIRIAGVAMAPEIGAISVPIDNVLSGTWHADVVFNTAFPYSSLDDVFAIALHEAGNVFGLKDNDDPSSPMKAGPIPTATNPTSADIAALRSLHGARAPDINELDDDNNPTPNDSRATATEWEPGGGDDDAPGAIPALAQGDLQSVGDVDYFALKLPDGYSGPLTVTMRSDGVSLLRPSLRLDTASGTVLGEASGVGQRGDRVSVTTTSVVGGQTVYVRASAASDAGLFAIGGYSLVAVFDATNIVAPERIEAASAARIRGLEVNDLQQVFEPGEDAFRNDFGNDDSIGSATSLVASAGFAASSRYEIVASIGVPADIDHYRVAPPGGETTVAYFTVRSLNIGRLVPSIEVLTDQGVAVPTRVLVNGAGELLVEADTMGVVGDLIVRVAASTSAGPFTRGNYSLSAGFVESPATLSTFAAGSLVRTDSVSENTFYVAEPQLFHFVLAVESAVPSAAAVVVEVRNTSGAVVTTIVAPVDESRSAGAAFLPIGDYTAAFSVVALGDSITAPLQYALIGAPFSDPFVGDGSDPTTNPFDCGTNDGFYCYPGGIVSSDPYLWEDFITSLSEAPAPGDSAEEIRRLLGDWWSWVWTQLGVNGPPLAQSDDYTIQSSTQSLLLARAVSPHNVLANDFEPETDPLVAVLAVAPRHGDVVVHPNGTFAYTPVPGFVGFDWFRYTAYDFVNESNQATVWVSVSGASGLEGDYNGDSAVDYADGDFWRGNYGETGGPADGNRDGVVDSADYTLWRDNLGSSSSAQAAPLPVSGATPNTASLATLHLALESRSSTRPLLRSPLLASQHGPMSNRHLLLLVTDLPPVQADEAFATWRRPTLLTAGDRDAEVPTFGLGPLFGQR